MVGWGGSYVFFKIYVDHCWSMFFEGVAAILRSICVPVSECPTYFNQLSFAHGKLPKKKVGAPRNPQILHLTQGCCSPEVVETSGSESFWPLGHAFKQLDPWTWQKGLSNAGIITGQPRICLKTPGLFFLGGFGGGTNVNGICVHQTGGGNPPVNSQGL